MHFVAVKISTKLSGVVIYFMSAARGGGVGDTQQSYVQGGSTPRSNPLPFYVPFLTEKILLSNTFYRQTVPLSHT